MELRHLTAPSPTTKQTSLLKSDGCYPGIEMVHLLSGFIYHPLISTITEKRVNASRPVPHLLASTSDSYAFFATYYFPFSALL